MDFSVLFSSTELKSKIRSYFFFLLKFSHIDREIVISIWNG